MDRLPDHMTNGVPFHMWIVGGTAALVVLALLYLLMFFLRHGPARNLHLAELATARSLPIASDGNSASGIARTVADELHDTIFILPDISHYTRFMTGNQFAFGHARYIIFSLINAMIKAATRTVELSKLEGDAALFYVDAQKRSAAEIGGCVEDILRAFYGERGRLIAANLCGCHACRHIDDLELKIFIHRGQAARFKFRGSVDHFGTDVIILHRIMKNGVAGDRYVMVTQGTLGSVSIRDGLHRTTVREDVVDVGPVQADVFEVDNAMVDEFSENQAVEHHSAVIETFKKLRENARTLWHAFGFRT